MAFGPLTTPRRRQKIASYDLEWRTDTGKVTVNGLFIRDKYRAYATPAELLGAMFRRENLGYYFYAHSGGRHDLTHLASLLRDSGKPVECHVVGSRIILAIVREAPGSRNAWYLADSLAVLKSGLADIGKAIGLPKFEGDTDDMSPAELFLRNKRDCEIVVRALERTQERLWDLGGELKHTIGSCAMATIRRAFLRETVVTRKDDNAWARGAYHASRVEVFRYRDYNGMGVDLNSAFPYAITLGLPGERIRIDQRIPEGESYWCADVDVTVPTGHIPPLPYRKDERIYFPTGKFRTRLTRIMAELLWEYGGTIDKVHEVHHYAPGLSGLTDFVKKIYDHRKNSTDKYERLLDKFLLNTGYGKLAERGDKACLLINPDELPPQDTCLLPGVYRVPTEREIAHEHVIAAVWITDVVKALLTRRLWLYGDLAAYCDTDCVQGPDIGLPSSDELGEWKHEERYVIGDRIGPKLYALLLPSPLRPKIAAKGFAKPDYDAFCDLREGLEREYEWFATPREALRFVTKPERGEALQCPDCYRLFVGGEECPEHPGRARKPLVGRRRKGLTLQCPVCYRLVDDVGDGCPEHPGHAQPQILLSGKRARVGEFDTRPWTVEEVESLAKRGKKRR